MAITIIIAGSVAFTKQHATPNYPVWVNSYEDSLLFLYSQPASQWPKPFIDSGVLWSELGVVPDSPLKGELEKLKEKIELGKLLFFDPRLSGSGQISCASCHVPDLSWTDGREKSAGHDQQLNKRNAPTILNVWFYKNLFWDGRSSSLADQAFSPINSEVEMHNSMSAAIDTLRHIAPYKPLFKKAFGSPEISPETVTAALACFEKTIVSRKADFDRFINGDTNAISKAALRGLHLFRTKARCMNCHNGPLLSDNSFHNIGLTYYGRQNEDLGHFKVTHDPEDIGKFKTPSLRDVMRTRPWMHNGLFDNIEGIMNMYSAGMPQPRRKPGEENDPLFPKTDPLIQKLSLTKEEKADLIAFLESITSIAYKMKMPALPGR